MASTSRTGMTDVEIAWVAGLLEGEGSFSLGDFHNRTRNPVAKGVRSIRISCAMTDRDVLERLKSILKTGNISGPRYDKRYTNGKPLYSFFASKRADVVPILHDIEPLMGERRGDKVRELIKYAEDNPMIYGTLVHGRNGYRKGCKCEICMEAMRSYAREYNARKRKESNV